MSSRLLAVALDRRDAPTPGPVPGRRLGRGEGFAWVVPADSEGDEFRVLPPRSDG